MTHENKKYLYITIQLDFTEMCLKWAKYPLHYQLYNGSDQNCMTLLIITIASISGTMLWPMVGPYYLLLSMCLQNEWIHGRISKWFKMHCKLQRVIQMQTIAVSIQLKVGFMSLYVRSPEQAADAEGRVELGYNANSQWCPFTTLEWFILQNQGPLHSHTLWQTE